MVSVFVLLGLSASWHLIANASQLTDQQDAHDCFCTPSDANCWPTSQDLDEFAKTLSSPQALLRSLHPPAYPCHNPDFDQTECAAAYASWNDSQWRTDQPGGMVDLTFEAAAAWQADKSLKCNVSLEDDSSPCGQGSVPLFGVEAHSEQDIIEALDFAQKRNLPISVKNSGHDYFGRSFIPDSFMIWTHKLDDLNWIPEYTPSTCEKAESVYALQIGAGVQWNTVYKSAVSVDRTIAGGVSPNGTVGAAGGWLLGGGHSILSPMYGLGVDNVVEFRVVIPSPSPTDEKPKVVTVNECSNPDLFWALRGGGGGTFGIVTQVVYKSYPSTPVITGNFLFAVQSGDIFQNLLETFIPELPGLSDKRWGGYWLTSATKNAATFVTDYTFAYYFMRANYTSEEAKELTASMSSLLSRMEQACFGSTSGASTSTTGKAPSLWTMSELPNFYTWYQQSQKVLAAATAGRGVRNPIVNGGTYYLSSRLLPDYVHTGNIGKKFIEYLLTVQRTFVGHVPGGAVSIPDPDAMALHPAWRTAISHMLAYDTPEANAERSTMKFFMDIIGGDGGGSYLNEASYEDPTWPISYWGSHYDRLLAIKEKYDPTHHLVVTQGVGSEQRTDDLKCKRH